MESENTRAKTLPSINLTEVVREPLRKAVLQAQALFGQKKFDKALAILIGTQAELQRILSDPKFVPIKAAAMMGECYEKVGNSIRQAKSRYQEVIDNEAKPLARADISDFETDEIVTHARERLKALDALTTGPIRTSPESATVAPHAATTEIRLEDIPAEISPQVVPGTIAMDEVEAFECPTQTNGQVISTERPSLPEPVQVQPAPMGRPTRAYREKTDPHAKTFRPGEPLVIKKPEGK